MNRKRMKIINTVLPIVILLLNLRVIWCFGIGLDEVMSMKDFHDYASIYIEINCIVLVILIILNFISFVKNKD